MNSGFLSYIIRKMSSSTSVQLVPVGVRGMKVLDRHKFLRKLCVPVLKVKEDNLVNIIRICKKYLLKLESFKPVQTLDVDTESYQKCIHLNPEEVANFTDIIENDRTELKQLDVTVNNFDRREIELNYDNFKHELIFKAVLPEDEEVVSGFSQIGHVIHLNLREHLLDYRQLIGQVLLDKIKRCETVVNKSNIIDNTFRNFSMEVIAGVENFLVTTKESRCLFKFDFSKVYWNPRLSTEHERIVSYLTREDVLFDVFCGVGPFAIPTAKKKIKVYANDLNPEAYKWLQHNAEKNKVGLFCNTYNQDGKDFICNVFRRYLVDVCRGVEKLKGKIYVTMNLPAIAVEFLKHFNGLLKDEPLVQELNHEILVYVYCFVIGDDPVESAKKLVCENIGCDVTSDIIDVFDVRNVSPKKEMMRVTLKLTKDVLFGVSGQPPCKKKCV